VQNAIDLAHAVGYPRSEWQSCPRGNDQSKGSVHDRSRGAVRDGRSGSDNRRATGRSAGVGQCDQPRAAAIKHIVSPVAGRGEPAARAGSRGWEHAGQSCRSWRGPIRRHRSGGPGPIILTSRADSLLARLAFVRTRLHVARFAQGTDALHRGESRHAVSALASRRAVRCRAGGPPPRTPGTASGEASSSPV